MRFKLLAAATALAISPLGIATDASAQTVNATGSGWCNSSTGCNNTNTQVINNHYAGHESAPSEFRNWFAFLVPNAPIQSASISIWSDALNSSQPGSGNYNLFGASALNYAGLTNGSSIGSVSVANTHLGSSGYVTIQLNSLGLQLLNSSAGSNFLFGGDVTGTTGGVFGYTSGTPKAYLTLNSVAAVPEPATWAMMLLGFGAIGYSMRRRRQLCSLPAMA